MKNTKTFEIKMKVEIGYNSIEYLQKAFENLKYNKHRIRIEDSVMDQYEIKGIDSSTEIIKEIIDF